VSRIDTAVDSALDEIGTPEALVLRGNVGIANARVIYARFRKLFYSARFAALRLRGVRVQRVLWGSTGTKNAAYPDVRYVEELIGPDTINTIPPSTLQAFREHGRVRGLTLEQGLPEAKLTLNQLSTFGIDLDTIAQQLQTDGVAAFSSSLNKLSRAIEDQATQHGACVIVGRSRPPLRGCLTNVPKPSETTFETGGRLVRPLPRQHAYAESVSVRRTRSTSGVGSQPSANLPEVFLETCFAPGGQRTVVIDVYTHVTFGCERFLRCY
jgi:hypothetical protein